MSKPLLLVLALVASTGRSFTGPPGTPGRVARGAGAPLGFGFNGLGGDDDGADAEPDDQPEKKIGVGGLVQLIAAGMGAPFLGDYEGTDDDGKLMFSLEANNLVDEDGNSKQTQMPYFENGWVEEEDAAAPSEGKAGGGFKFPWQK